MARNREACIAYIELLYRQKARMSRCDGPSAAKGGTLPTTARDSQSNANAHDGFVAMYGKVAR